VALSRARKEPSMNSVLLLLYVAGVCVFFYVSAQVVEFVVNTLRGKP